MAPRSLVSSAPEITGSSDHQSSERKEILCGGYLYDVTDWIHRHPGGKIIEFYTIHGEDATLAIQQFHHRSAVKVSKFLKSFKRRPAPVESGVDLKTKERYAALTEDFVKLYRDLEDEGYFEPSLGHLAYRVGELIFLLVVGFCMVKCDNLWLKSMGILCGGIFGGRCGWLQHEGGHNSLSGNPKVDKIICAAALGFGFGGSGSWWNSQHNRHHAMPQRLTRDVDLDTMPLLAFNTKAVKNPEEAKHFFVKYQAILFFTIDTLLVVVFWKLYLHPRRMIYKKEYLEMFFVALHYVLASQVGFIPYILVHWIGGTYMFTNFALSHTHLPVTTEPKHWVEYGLMHTIDIEPTGIVSWWMGYLNCQIEHHLFPAMPQFRQTRIRHRVRALAAKHNIPYQTCSYFDAVWKTFNNLQEVAHHLQDN